MKQPKIASTAKVMQGAQVLNNVTIGEKSSIWHGAVVRGDSNEIVIGDRCNIQDNSVIHTEKDCKVIIGDDVTIGHLCIVHGCSIGNNSLVGMGSVIMNGANIGDDCIIGAGSLVTEKTQIPSGSLAFGRPAKVVRQLTQQEIAGNTKNAQSYVNEMTHY